MPPKRRRTRAPLDVRRGALCRQDPRVHDAPAHTNSAKSRAHTRIAAAVCDRCPVFEPCRRWAEAQPKGSLDGIVAGRLYRTG